jgi:phenylpropionate dioxygenase-like ring-hydroxylating dioxygenase large terminal subunit
MPQTLLNDEFFASLDSSAAPIAVAETLPPECYTDEAFFQFEKEAIFYKEWLCVGRESWVKAPGDYFTTSIAGEPVVVTRNRSGVLNAMSSVCQHRAMLVADGRGNCRTFLCPYHHWAYNLDGDLIAAPAMDRTQGFSLKDHGLPRFRVEVWLGFIFINFDPHALPLAPRLAPVEAALANWRFAEAEDAPRGGTQAFPWNWKVMVENNNDGYHANKLHHGPLHDSIPSELSVFPDLPEDTAGYFRFNGTLHQDAGFNATQKALLPIFPHLTIEDRNRMVFAVVPPSFSLVATSDVVLWSLIRPQTAASIETDGGLLVAPGARSHPNFDNLQAVNNLGAQTIIAQDRQVDVMVQKGLGSKFAPRGRYSWQEGAQSLFNRWLVRRYQAAWRARAAASAA